MTRTSSQCATSAALQSHAQTCTVAVCACLQGLYPALAARLAEFDLHISLIYIKAKRSLTADNHGPALHAVLQQLQRLQTAADTVVQLKGLQWTAAMAATVAAAAPLLQHIRFSAHTTNALTDELLGALLQMSPPIRQVSVGALQVQSDQHANTLWPWDKLSFTGDTDMCSLLRLPAPRADSPTTISMDSPWQLQATQVSLAVH